VANQPQDDRALLGSRLLFGPVPALVLVLSLPLLVWHPITRQSHAKMVEEIAHARSKK
jgi:Na+/melibiose symporter-like transporter